MAVTPYLELFLPDGATLVADFVAGTADAMTKLDVWAQAHASGGGGGFNDGNLLSTNWKVTDVPTADESDPFNAAPALNLDYGTLSTPTSEWNDLMDIAAGDALAASPDGLAVGDDFVLMQLNEFAAELVAFKVPGLYVIQFDARGQETVSAQPLSSGHVGLSISGLELMTEQLTATTRCTGSRVFAVEGFQTWTPSTANGISFNMWQSSGVNADLQVDVIFKRVL